MGGMERGQASRTAVLVCQGRAVAQGRLAPGRFDDPTAMVLLRAEERAAVEVARGAAPSGSWSQRVEWEMLQGNAEVMAPRTVAIDDAVRTASHPQVVILGAGLDGRAWRLPELAGAAVFEVDHPASQADKRERAAALAARLHEVHWVPVDFGRDDLADALAGAGHQARVPTTWIWEGVVPYLTPAEVDATAATIAACSAPGSHLIVNYQMPSAGATVGRLVARTLIRLSRRADPTADEPRRSTWTPAGLAELLGRHGFTVERDDDLATVAADLDLALRHQRSARVGRVAVARR
jgi:methyltransferase (TIGR00027 family)